MFSAFFIRRPIFASVISILITLAGLAAMRVLPIEQYPQIVPPQVTVTAVYPGASADVIAKTVAAPLEQQINGVDNMLYMQSSSDSAGSMVLTVTFAIGTDPDQNTINVNNRVQAATAQLPQEVRQQGVTVQKKSANILQIATFSSPGGEYSELFISNYVLLNVLDELKRIPGVGDASIFGSKNYSMRIWLRQDKLVQLGLTPTDVVSAIKDQNSQFAAGKVGAEPIQNPVDFTYTVTTQGRLSDPAQFENIIIRANPDGSAIYLKDVARVDLGAQDYNFAGTLNGKPTIPVGIYLAPGANQLQVAEDVTKALAQMSQRFPTGLAYSIPYDTTSFVKISIEEVQKTLFEAMVLVFLVVYLFLQNWRATLIPCLAVPVSIIGTFAGMYALGFSINTLTLFGMVLAIGIVVDDAIVVLENVERIMSTEKLGPVDASIKAMQEVSGPVVAIVLVLCAVFVPVAFMGGLAGQMYKQFAITIAVSVVLSGIVALTLTPALCALLLKEGHSHPNRFFVWFNNFFDRVTARYTAGVRFFLKRTGVGLLVFAGLIAITVGLFRAVPSSLVPNEDQGYVLAAAFLPDAASLSRTEDVMKQFDQQMMKNPAVANVVTFSGFDLLSGAYKTSAGISFVTLKPWSERTTAALSSDAVVGDVFRIGSGIKGGFLMGLAPPPISGMSSTGGFEAYIQNRGSGGSAALAEAVQKVVAAAQKRPELAGVSTTYSANVPQLYVELDREKAKSYGVPVSQVFDTLQSTFGALYVNDFNKFGRTYKVQIQSESDYRSRPDDLNKVYVRSQSGQMIPLGSLIHVRWITGPENQERFNVFDSAKVIGGPAPGYSSGEAIAAMQEVTRDTLGDDFTIAWTGSAYQEIATGGTSAQIFIFALIVVFLILAAQYERWKLPLAVLMAVPFALFGAILATWARDLSNDVYFQVALVTLIGLAAKNAILIVEFAILKLDEGVDLIPAAIEAAHLRFRPILMTSLAFVLGCVPLVLSSGAGAASRHSLGTGIIGGMLGATFIATFLIPLFFVLIMRVGTRKKPKAPPSAAAAEHRSEEGQP